ncbi:aminotransferase class I/II-fold pyridoxal phosphate-dependent enzyme [Sphingomonas abaci]|uniref:Aminotransferase n=1 Tax=Sphingomonas abaci TaxID=237611 RepID=A0A7W7ALG4_9SPHN|nr:cobalamin biosynthetic protein CobC [Sphingomonas abaci]
MHDLTYHGGRLDVAAARYPDAPRPWIDLSTGLNPYPWDAASVPVDWRALPGGAARLGLETAAAATFGAAHLPVAAVPGSEAALHALAAINLPRPFAIVGPGYRGHGAALPGARPVAAGDLDAAAEAGGTLLLANPNNPDGRRLPPDRLLAVAATLAAKGGLLIVDEAFADAVPGTSVLPMLSADDPVLVLRSFGKMYGLAGLRLGFVLGAGPYVAAVAARMGSWPVSAAAIAIGTAAYLDRAWPAMTVARLEAAGARLDTLLRRHGLAPIGDCPLFRLIESDRAPAMFERLARAGILTRPFAEDARRLRFGLPGQAAAWDRLAAALAGG